LVASPESITLGQWLWIPGSRKSATRNDAEYDSKFKIAELAAVDRIMPLELARFGDNSIAAQ